MQNEYDVDMYAVTAKVLFDNGMVFIVGLTSRYDGPGEWDAQEFYNANQDRTHLFLDLKTTRRVLAHLGYCMDVAREQFLRLVEMLRANDENVPILYAFLCAYTGTYFDEQEYHFHTYAQFLQFVEATSKELEAEIELMIEQVLTQF